MSGREDETVAVEPLGGIRIVAEGVAVENSANVCGSEREAKVAGAAGVNAIDGEAAGFGSGLRQGFFVEFAHNNFLGSYFRKGAHLWRI